MPETNSSTVFTLDPSRKPVNKEILLSGSGTDPFTVLTKPSSDLASGTSKPDTVANCHILSFWPIGAFKGSISIVPSAAIEIFL